MELATDRLDINSLTGCLTFYDTYVENISINIEDMFCEDALNFVRVKGFIDTINIENSLSDAIDIDFSDVEIDSIKINNAKNDCVDFSKSHLTINEIIAIDCEDKGLSIGESTVLALSKLEVITSSIGIAVKDSSNVEIDTIEIISTDTCTAIYRKKQEFGPARLTTKNYKCENLKNDFIQMGSEFINLNGESDD